MVVPAASLEDDLTAPFLLGRRGITLANRFQPQKTSHRSKDDEQHANNKAKG
jgi:hypothetical protein